MAYEAEIETDRMARHAQTKGTVPTRVTRLGSNEIAATLRTQEKGHRNRVDITTRIKGWRVTLEACIYKTDGDVPQKTVTLLDDVFIDRLFLDEALVRRSPGGRVLPPLLPGEPDLTD